MVKSSRERVLKRLAARGCPVQISQQGPLAMKGRAFRFFNSAYLASVRRGDIRIGTLDSFRVQDGIDDGRSDAFEGVASWCQAEEVTLVKGDELRDIVLHQHIDPRVRSADFDQNFSLVIKKGGRHMVMVNAYVICFSLNLSDELCRNMYSKFGYDMYLEVVNMRKYLREIMRQFPENTEMAAVPINYVNELEDTRFVVDPFIKITSFSWQDEFRIVISGKSATPIIVAVPSTRRLVRVHKNPWAPSTPEILMKLASDAAS
ncbi:hypothetical protein SPAN111604_05515 [Sphingomonas antarctica]